MSGAKIALYRLWEVTPMKRKPRRATVFREPALVDLKRAGECKKEKRKQQVEARRKKGSFKRGQRKKRGFSAKEDSFVVETPPPLRRSSGFAECGKRLSGFFIIR